MTTIAFALNHITAPVLPLDDFFALAKSLGISAVDDQGALTVRKRGRRGHS